MNCFPTVITVANCFPTVIMTVANCLPTVITVANCYCRIVCTRVCQSNVSTLAGPYIVRTDWLLWLTLLIPVDTGSKLNVHKTFRRRPGRLLNVFCTFNLRPVSTGIIATLFSFQMLNLAELNHLSRLELVQWYFLKAFS